MCCVAHGHPTPLVTLGVRVRDAPAHRWLGYHPSKGRSERHTTAPRSVGRPPQLSPNGCQDPATPAVEPRTAGLPQGGNPAPGGFHYRPKMPKSSSEGFGIDRRSPSYSGGPTRLAKHTRHARPREVYLGVGWIPPLVKAPSNDTRPLADWYKACPD